MDGNEPAENNTLINDEESENAMLLGRGVNQQQYKGKIFFIGSIPLFSFFVNIFAFSVGFGGKILCQCILFVLTIWSLLFMEHQMRKKLSN